MSIEKKTQAKAKRSDGTLTKMGLDSALQRLKGKGGFAEALGDALSRADSNNQRRLVAAFPELLLGTKAGEICDEVKAFVASSMLADHGSFDYWVSLFNAMTFQSDFFEDHSIVIWEPYEDDDPIAIQRAISDTADLLQNIINTKQGFVR